MGGLIAETKTKKKGPAYEISREKLINGRNCNEIQNNLGIDL